MLRSDLTSSKQMNTAVRPGPKILAASTSPACFCPQAGPVINGQAACIYLDILWAVAIGLSHCEPQALPLNVINHAVHPVAAPCVQLQAQQPNLLPLVKEFCTSCVLLSSSMQEDSDQVHVHVSPTQASPTQKAGAEAIASAHSTYLE